ncbi:MAG: FkbM family methyltransferase [Candidatus Omnitrophota bacterium]
MTIMTNFKPLSIVKTFFVKKHRRARKIRSGIFKGLVMNIDLTYQAQLFLGLFERETYKWVSKFAKGINAAIDVGAGEGEYTIYFLKKTSAKKVFSFEPNESKRRLLTNNLGVSDIESGKILLYSKMLSSSSSDNSITLDSIISRVLTPCLLKIDTDGTEVDILKGAGDFLKLGDIRFIIETHSKTLEEDCISILNKAGFTTKVIPNAWWRLFIPEQRPSIHNRWLAANNTLYK